MRKTVLLFLAMGSLAVAAETASLSDQDRLMRDKADQIHRLIWERFVHPETNMYYDYIPAPSTPNIWTHLPTAAEIKANTPNVCGWGAGMEDCCINGGAYLATMVMAFDATKDKQYEAKARRIYSGLRTLGTIAPRKGFVARAVTPDGKNFYTNSSVDQYTLFIYGLWSYYNSTIASDDEKSEIRSIFKNVCARVEDDGFDILCADGKPALVSDIGVIRSDRSSRLLSLFLFGATINNDAHWKMIYDEKLRENNHARLRDITTPSRVDILPWKSRQSVYGILQNQVSLLPLLQMEQNLPVKSMYLEAIRLNARLVEERLLIFRKYDPAIHSDDYTLGEWRQGKPARPKSMSSEMNLVRDPCEALVTILMAQGAYLIEKNPGLQEKHVGNFVREILLEMMQKYDFEKMRTFSMLYAEMSYWLAVKNGLVAR